MSRLKNIFICYRRDDAAGYAGRLYDSLEREFGADSLFRDIDTLQPGDDFEEGIRAVLGCCDVVLAILGPRWLDSKDTDGRRRIDDESDFVRFEIQTALERGVRVIPLLVQGATMPKASELPPAVQALTRKQALEMVDARWSSSMDVLFEILEDKHHDRATMDAPAAFAASMAREVDSPPTQEANYRPPKPSQASNYSGRPKSGVKQSLIAKVEGDCLWQKDDSLFVVAPGNSHFASVRTRGGFLGFWEKMLVELDGNQDQAFDFVSDLRFSPQGDRLAYRVRADDRWTIVIDGKQATTLHQSVLDRSLRFSPDGRRFGYVGVSGRSSYLVIDGQRAPSFELHQIGGLFSADSQRIAYGAFSKDIWTVIADDLQYPAHNALGAGGPAFTSDSAHVAFCFRLHNKWAISVDGEEGPHFDAIGVGPVMSPTGQRIAYTAKTIDSWVAVIDGDESRRYDAIAGDSLKFSEDGSRFAYSAIVGGGALVVADGKENELFGAIGNRTITFSRDGRRLAYAAKRGANWTVVADGTTHGSYGDVAEQGLIFSPDGKRLAFAGKVGDQWSAVVDWHAGPQYGGVSSVSFSPDGKHLVYVATKYGGCFLVADHVERAMIYSGAVPGSSIAWDSPHSCSLLVHDRKNVYRVTLFLAD